MKGLILCGGKGSRLWPISLSIPKQLIPIGNRPILFYIIDSLIDAKIKEIGIVINENQRYFEQALSVYEKQGIQFEYINQEKPLGLANALFCAKDYIKNDNFIMILGDNLYELNLKHTISEFIENNSNCKVLLKEVKDPERFGVATVKNNKIIDVVEKPKEPVSNLAITGIYLFDHNIFTACASIHPSQRGEYEITDAIKWLIDNDYRVSYQSLNGMWKDVGNPDQVIEANQYRLSKINHKILGKIDSNSNLSGTIYLGYNTHVDNSIIRGPVFIGDNVVITNSYIGPYTSIYDHVIIKNAEVENSIILSNSSILNVEKVIDASIIASNTEIYQNHGTRKINKFIVGKNSRITLN